MSLEDIRNERLKKLASYREAGFDAYPSSGKRTHTIAEARKEFKKLAKAKKNIMLAGRLVAIRGHGGSTFANVRDESGGIQIFLQEDKLGNSYRLFSDSADIGDFVEVSGTLFQTKRGEETLTVKTWRFLAKSLRPLPEKWHGLADIEERLRRRYVDLVMNPEERALFVKKAKFWNATRAFLEKKKFLEVETPVLEQTPGGADAEPFVTHLNALDIDLYLRISPELHLKRLLVAGFERVYEIGRIFRNEGIDREHLQDYTSLELYWAYVDYKTLMQFVELLMRFVIRETLGSLKHSWQGQTIDWGKKWQMVDYANAFKKYTGLDLETADEGALKTYAAGEGIDVTKHIGRGRLIDVIFKKKVRPTLVQPSFLILPPVDIEPLAKRDPKNPKQVERFQVVACGTELGKGFSELNDPVDQRMRFEGQMALRERGDREAQRIDEDFVEALEYGMPPAAGFSYSERLFSVLVDRPVRETVFFPLMRPK